VKLGGPVAAFFATMMFLAWFYARTMKTVGAAADLAAPFAGGWHVSATSNKNKRQASSDIEAIVGDDEHLSFSGNFLDAAGKPIGEWRTENVFCATNGLAYKYWLTDGFAPSKANWVGFCTLFVKTRGEDGRPTCLEGTWDVIGPEHHDGTITFTRPAAT
jgi:hypothetical protein